MRIEEVWTGRTASAFLARAALLPITALYTLGWEGYLAIYRFGFKKPYRSRDKIICVGNLVVGGSGKTPFTLFLAETLMSMGHRVVIGASGYGGPHSVAAAVAPDGPLSAAEWGDEPAAFRDELPDVPLIVGRRRVLAAQLCEEHFPGAILVMDDGFQHLPVAKTLCIVLDPPTRNRFCLPAGPYREGPWNRSRADMVLPGEFRVVRSKTRLESPFGEAVKMPGEYQLLCALGQPEKFIDAIREDFPEANLVRAKCLADHDPLVAGNLWEGLNPGLPVIVTGKDWVKLRDRSDVGGYNVVIARHRVSVEPANEWRNWLGSKLHE